VPAEAKSDEEAESVDPITPSEAKRMEGRRGENAVGDLPGAIVSDADRMLVDKVYGDHVHQNPGTHLNGGIEDDAMWQRYHRRLIVYPSQRYDAPNGPVGRRLVETMTSLLEGVRSSQEVEFRALPPVPDCCATANERSNTSKGHQEAPEMEDGRLGREKVYHARPNYGARHGELSVNKTERSICGTEREDLLVKEIIKVIICSNLVRGRTSTLPWRHRIGVSEGWSVGLSAREDLQYEDAKRRCARRSQILDRFGSWRSLATKRD
jgi:hypothetical protein